ncbi:MAG: hypothetical protein CM15mP58_22060 [Burkholderiaceae bacterium]|nr:MAG: hypothetical protein CM15mP58_22060 [Burkholderiaceae bacterium]
MESLPVFNAQLLQFMAPGDDDIERVEVLKRSCPHLCMVQGTQQRGYFHVHKKILFNQGPRVEITAGERKIILNYIWALWRATWVELLQDLQSLIQILMTGKPNMPRTPS